ncbi:MAG: penicillin-binding transpeptidase domain-containing protein, partial [Clostridia bacterium]
ADKIREKNLIGIEFTGDTKRYYPNGNLACHLLGFTGKDGQGLEGLENILDDELSGTAGRVRSAKSAGNGEMPFKYETYEAAKDGNNVILTIDKSIQQFLENHLQTAYEENKLGNGAAGIIMNPKTGEILAMAVCPSYDLSDYGVIKDESLLAQVDKLVETSAAEYEEAQARIAAGKAKKGDEDVKALTRDEAYSRIVLKMRRNKAVVDSYEPGSTFKTITASAALEENVVSLDDTFVCTGVKVVEDRKIHCWKLVGHGTETFVDGIKNSCNPVFMEVGARLGAKNFYKYFQAFGLTEKTGFLIPGESEGTHHSLSGLGPVELATCSFGQSFTVTPLQMVRAVSAVVNGGYLMEPHIVKSYTDSEGNIIENVDPVVVRRVISQQTSDTMRGVLEKVVSEGGGSGAYVKGYRIGGKTGTSEKLPRESGLTVASFVGFAPADDPEIVCLIILDEPMNGLNMGGQIAAPTAGAVIEDTLKYLGYEPQYTEEESAEASVIVPDVTGQEIDKAKTEISDLGFKASVKGSGETVTKQIPRSGTKLHSGSVVILYTEEMSEGEAAVEVPSVRAKTYSQAKEILENAGLEISADAGVPPDELDSSYLAISQSPAAKSYVAKGTKVYVNFVNEELE